jgi:hypothetical protein
VLPPENEIVPACLRGEVTFKQDVVGQFTVCPFGPAKPGAMRMVCVDEVRAAVARSIVAAGQRAVDRKIEDCRVQGSGG